MAAPRKHPVPQRVHYADMAHCYVPGKRLAQPPLGRSGDILLAYSWRGVSGRQAVDSIDLVFRDSAEDLGSLGLPIDAVGRGDLDSGRCWRDLRSSGRNPAIRFRRGGGNRALVQAIARVRVFGLTCCQPHSLRNMAHQNRVVLQSLLRATSPVRPECGRDRRGSEQLHSGPRHGGPRSPCATGRLAAHSSKSATLHLTARFPIFTGSGNRPARISE